MYTFEILYLSISMQKYMYSSRIPHCWRLNNRGREIPIQEKIIQSCRGIRDIASNASFQHIFDEIFYCLEWFDEKIWESLKWITKTKSLAQSYFYCFILMDWNSSNVWIQLLQNRRVFVGSQQYTMNYIWSLYFLYM